MGRFDNMMRINAQRKNESLTAEIERLKEELNAAKFVNCERCVEKTATRCAEIADNMKYNSHASPSDYEEACLDIFDAIESEFGLPKTG